MIKIGIDGFGLGRSHYTGKENYVLSIINGLLKIRNDLAFRIFLPKNFNKLPSFGGGNVEFIYTAESNSYTIWNQLFLPFALKSTQLDVMVFTESMIPIINYSYNFKEILIVYDVMFHNVGKEFDRKTKYLLGTLLPHSLNKADSVVTISEASQKDIIHFYGCPGEKIFVIPPGIELKEFNFDNNFNHNLLKRFNINSRYITYIGNHEKYKNLNKLLEAFKILTNDQKFNDLGLLLIGKNDKNTPSLIQKIKELGLENKVIITGYISDNERNTLLHGSQLLVLPSMYEGFGIPLIEAMAIGVPVATSNISSMPEVIGNAGLTFDPKNKDDITISLKKILLDSELKAELIKKGLERVKIFDYMNSAKKFSCVLDILFNRFAK